MNNSFNIPVPIHTNKAMYQVHKCFMLCFKQSIQWYLSPLNSRRVTFSLLLSSLNISSISCLQSSCMVWKLSWGVVIKGEVDISSSRRRISAKVGLWWDSWCQQSEKVTIHRKCCLVSSLYFQKLLDQIQMSNLHSYQ